MGLSDWQGNMLSDGTPLSSRKHALLSYSVVV